MSHRHVVSIHVDTSREPNASALLHPHFAAIEMAECTFFFDSHAQAVAWASALLAAAQTPTLIDNAGEPVVLSEPQS